MSVALSFVTDEHAVLVSDSQRTLLHPDTNEVVAARYIPKVFPMDGGFVSATGPTDATRTACHALAEEPAGDLELVREVVEDCAPTSTDPDDALHVVQVFAHDGETGTLDWSSDGVGDRVTQNGASLIGGPPSMPELTLEEVAEIQREAMIEASEGEGPGEVVEALWRAVRRLEARSRFIGGPVQYASVRADGAMHGAFQLERVAA